MATADEAIKKEPEQYGAYEVKVDTDYDGYFEAWLRGLLEKKRNKLKRLLRHKRFVVSAAAFRGYDVQYEQVLATQTLKFDCYSVARHHPGRLEQYNDEILELL